MSEPIKVGDLVQVILPRHCGCTTYLGRVFVVTGLIVESRPCFCSACGDRGITTGTRVLGCESVVKGRAAISSYRLKRIPPLSELEGAIDWQKLVEKVS